MDVLLITFQAVAALLGIGIIGFWVLGRRHVSAEVMGFLSTLSIDIAVPCLTLSSMLLNFSPQNTPDWWKMPLWWMGFTAVAFILALITSRIADKERRAEFTIGVFFQNGLFFPILIIAGLFGPQNPYFALLFLFVFLQPTVMFSTYSFFFKNKDGHGQPLNLRRLINPVIVATLIGLGIALVGLSAYIPDFIQTILISVGAMASPLFMLILGGTIYNDVVAKTPGQEKQKVYIKDIIKFILVKNIIYPLVFLLLLIWMKPDFPVALIVLIQAAVPPVTAIPIFAQRSGGNRSAASQFVVGSFIASIVTIPLSLLAFSQFFPFPG